MHKWIHTKSWVLKIEKKYILFIIIVIFINYCLKILTAVAIQQSTQLRLLDPATVCQLLPSCLPREWLRKSSGSDGLSRGVLGNNGVQNKMQVNDGGVDKGGLINGVVIDGGGVEFPVTWNSQTKGYPPEGWLKALWGFLSRNFPRDLSCVDHLPIIPYQKYHYYYCAYILLF